LKLRASPRALAQIRRALTPWATKLRGIHDLLTQLKIYAMGKRFAWI